jgi:hypothetical protein
MGAQGRARIASSRAASATGVPRGTRRVEVLGNDRIGPRSPDGNGGFDSRESEVREDEQEPRGGAGRWLVPRCGRQKRTEQ